MCTLVPSGDFGCSLKGGLRRTAGVFPVVARSVIEAVSVAYFPIAVLATGKISAMSAVETMRVNRLTDEQ